jgi:hypothetical protein
MVSQLVTAETLAPGSDVDVKPESGDTRFYSVTTILSALNTPAFVYWSAEETATEAVKLAGQLPAMIAERGRDEVVRHLAAARNRPPAGRSRTASELGTDVHSAFEQYALSGVKPDVDDEVQPYLDRFDEWAQKWQPVYLAAECAVFNERYGYAGTLDATAIIDGATVHVDYKSSRKTFDSRGKERGPYPVTALQLAGYRHAEFVATWRARRYERHQRRYYLLNDDERAMSLPVPAVDGSVVLHVTPEHADMYPVRTDWLVFERFLYVIEAFKWQQEISKTVIGEKLERGHRADH